MDPVNLGKSANLGQSTNLEESTFEKLSFEELVSALEALTDRLASGQIGIEEAADLYEQAERLHGLARQRLASVQARIESLGASAAPPTGPRPPG